MISIRKVIAASIIIFAVSVSLGYLWAFSAYQPLKLAQENRELRAELNQRWTRDFSRENGLIEKE